MPWIGYEKPTMRFSTRCLALGVFSLTWRQELLLYLLQLVQALKYEKMPRGAEDAAHDSSLARFLISRATRSMMLGNFFHWYLMVECDESSPGQGTEYRKLFARVEYDFMTELLKVLGSFLFSVSEFADSVSSRRLTGPKSGRRFCVRPSSSPFSPKYPRRFDSRAEIGSKRLIDCGSTFRTRIMS